jgi:hypothetical protein
MGISGNVAMFGLGIFGALAITAAGFWLYVMSTVEQPKYALSEQDGAIELRSYPALVVAEVIRCGLLDRLRTSYRQEDGTADRLNATEAA